MAPHEFLLPINLKKSKKLWKFGFFDLWPLFGLQNFFWPFFQFSWPSDVLNIPNHLNLNYFEAILQSNIFCWKIRKPDQCDSRSSSSPNFSSFYSKGHNIPAWLVIIAGSIQLLINCGLWSHSRKIKTPPIIRGSK